MRRLSILLALTALAAACGSTVDEAAPPEQSSAGLFLARSAAVPAGDVRAADGSAAFAARGSALLRFDPDTGRRTGTYDLPGAWALEGVSATGRWVGLTRPGTEILVLDTESGEIAHELSLDGSFVVETISADGGFLFLQQNLVDGRYVVRGYDLARDRLLPGSLAAKGETVVMQGLASQTVASPDGRWLLTLYVNTKSNSAFVHALDLVEKVPICIVMPPCEECDTDDLTRWALALAPDGRTLYAANPAAGRVAEIDLASSRVVAAAGFAPAAGGPTFVEASADGTRVLFTNGADVWSYDPQAGDVAALGV